MNLEIENLSICYGNKTILSDINLTFEPKIIAIIGPNGAGKSTLIKAIAGINKAKQGTITFNKKKIDKSYKEFYSKYLGYFPQFLPTNTVLTVFEVILLGMIDSLSLRVSDEELIRVMSIMKKLNIDGLAKKRMSELSGGQQQMVSLAQAIIKDPKVLLLDEPLNNLDIYRQFEILDIIKKITYENNIITVIAIHDLNLAARYADEIIVIHDGQIYSQGSPEEVLTEDLLRQVYKVNAEITVDSNNILSVNPIGMAQ
ncbi:MAG: ABC transporter ATP-binding protein [Clostridium sp.]|nr:ABC transporter ATP-binding protein [Clostridium sp.]